MIRNPAGRRSAFTLIELLVVISIIAVLAAITSGVFGRLRVSQTKSSTDATLSKINSLIERRWNAVLGQVNEDIKSNHPGYAAVLGNVQNPDLAKAIWTHAKMKSELPMSLAEAKNPVSININGTVVWNIPIKAIYNALPAEPVGPNQAYEESAACLYMAVMANAGGGTAAESDGIQQQTGTTAGGAKCFKDAWGTPIAFIRTAFNGEMNQRPFFVPTTSNPNPFDPFDPRSKLVTQTGVWTTTGANNSLTLWWTTQRLNAPAFVGVPAAYPPATNFTWTAISAGPNKAWGADIYGLAAGDADPGKDNQVSYRLRREGARGD